MNRKGIGGRPADPRKAAYAKQYGITSKRRLRKFSWHFMNQLDACKSEEARRMILGLNEVADEPMGPDAERMMELSEACA